MGEIWAILEHEQNVLHEQSAEILSEAVDIAHRQQEQTTVHAVLLSAPDAQIPDLEVLSASGVDTLDVLKHTQLAYYTTEGYVSALAWFIQSTLTTAGTYSCYPKWTRLYASACGTTTATLYCWLPRSRYAR